MIDELTKVPKEKPKPAGFRPPSPPMPAPSRPKDKDPRARRSFEKGPIGPRTPAQDFRTSGDMDHEGDLPPSQGEGRGYNGPQGGYDRYGD